MDYSEHKKILMSYILFYFQEFKLLHNKLYIVEKWWMFDPIIFDKVHGLLNEKLSESQLHKEIQGTKVGSLVFYL